MYCALLSSRWAYTEFKRLLGRDIRPNPFSQGFSWCGLRHPLENLQLELRTLFLSDVSGYHGNAGNETMSQ